MAKIGKFWVVIKPTKKSVLLDIVFLRDVKGMGLQYLGGLKPSEIYGTYTLKSEAYKIAKKLLAKIN